MLSRLPRLGLLVPANFRVDLGFRDQDPGLGSEGRLEPSERSVKGKGNSICNVLLCVWYCMLTSCSLICSILINEQRGMDLLVRSLEEYFLSSY